MMILLINPGIPPDSPWGLSKLLPPLGLAYVAASLENAGFKVRVYDNYLHKKPATYMSNLVRELKPDIVGIGCNSVNYRLCIGIAKAVKEANPDCKVIVGGPHATYSPESMLKYQEIDYAIVGEGERATVELIKCIEEGEDLREISKIPGVACRIDGKIWENPPKLIEDLDEIPFPARHLLSMELYDRKIEYLDVEPADVMNVVRGCPFDCDFCETKKIWGYTCRTFTPYRIVEEIKHLIDNYGSKGVYFIGDNFTVYKERTLEFCELLKKNKIDIEWACDTRVDLVSRELLYKMKEAGCKTIWFGIESGSPKILKEINRGFTVEQAINAVKLCKKVGIRTACSFMIGMPSETIEDMMASFKLAKKLNPDWCQFNIYVACPGSKMYEEVLQKGLYDRKEDFLLYVKTENFNYESLLKIHKMFMDGLGRTPKRLLRAFVRKLLKTLKPVKP